MSEFLIDDFTDFKTRLEQNRDTLEQEIYAYQVSQNLVYKNWVQNTPRPRLEDGPLSRAFLPISFYKTQKISSLLSVEPSVVFESSGTTGQVTSKSPLYRPKFYRQNSLDIFERSIGSPVTDYRILALLPHYLKRQNSSLVHMVADWMAVSPQSGHAYYMHDTEALLETLKDRRPTLLIGVTYALIDLVPEVLEPLDHCIVIETGGMKGRSENWTKPQLHEYLEQGLGAQVYSEYGMTELMSQAYMKSGGRFYPPPQLRFYIREETDPLSLHRQGRGALCVMDLANMDTCSFIATDDLAYLYEDGSVEILGRLDEAEVRGCSQLYFG